MDSIGETFKKAREARGLDLPSAARVTRIKLSQLTDMEKDDFRSIPAPVYVRGFIKQYAKYLGLDAEPLLAQYNAQQSAGGPQAPPSMRPAGTGPAPKPPPPAEPAKPARETPREPDLFAPRPAPAAARDDAGKAPPPPEPAVKKPAPLVMEKGVPELLRTPDAPPVPEKVPAWKDPVVIETGRLVETRREPAADDRFGDGGEGPEAAPPEPRFRSFPPGVLRKVGIALGVTVVLVLLLQTCGRSRPEYTSPKEVPLPEFPVLREPADPYMQPR